MNYYSVKVHLRPELRYGSLPGGQLSGALADLLEDVIVAQWAHAPTGGVHLRLEFSRPSRGELMAEIHRAAEQVGYTLMEAEVEEFVDKAVSGTIIGFCGTGGAARLKTENPLLTLTAAVIGGYVGKRAGESMRTLVASHRYQLHRNGRWIFTELPVIAAPEEPVWQPAGAVPFPT
jgi:hypothetical protein